MPEQTFAEAVRESRIFYRRRLAERLALATIRCSGGFDPIQIASKADQLSDAVFAFEDRELADHGGIHEQCRNAGCHLLND
jgi:hypothetical protein